MTDIAFLNSPDFKTASKFSNWTKDWGGGVTPPHTPVFTCQIPHRKAIQDIITFSNVWCVLGAANSQSCKYHNTV